jgi:hypothetical protein
MPQDPFLVVQPSLNDSVLVKQGLVEETTVPQPTHSAHNIQVCFQTALLPTAMIERHDRARRVRLFGAIIRSNRRHGDRETVPILRHSYQRRKEGPRISVQREAR